MIEKVELKEKVSGITHRDTYSKALLNSDQNAYVMHKIRKQKQLNQDAMYKKLQSNSKEISELKSELKDIKELLTLLVKK